MKARMQEEYDNTFQDIKLQYQQDRDNDKLVNDIQNNTANAAKFYGVISLFHKLNKVYVPVDFYINNDYDATKLRAIWDKHNFNEQRNRNRSKKNAKQYLQDLKTKEY